MRSTPHHPYLDALRQPTAQLLLYGPPGVIKQPLPEGLVLKVPLYKSALYLGAPAATGCCFAHGPLSLRCRPNH